MITLLFDEGASESNNQFNEKFNTTVRRGTKYLETLRPGCPIKLESLKGEFLGHGQVYSMFCGTLGSIPDVILAMEHDPKCRTADGLIGVLRNAYHDDSIDETVIVTAITFVPAED